MTYPNTTTAYITYTNAEMAEREAHAARVAWSNTMRLRLDRDSRRTVLRAWGAYSPGVPSEPVTFLLIRKVQR